MTKPARVLVFIGRTMPVTLLGAACRPSGDLTTKNNHSRYHENNY
jgi:hypothetical protein